MKAGKSCMFQAIARRSCNCAFTDVFLFEFKVAGRRGKTRERERERKIAITKPLSPDSESQVPCADCKTRTLKKFERIRNASKIYCR